MNFVFTTVIYIEYRLKNENALQWQRAALRPETRAEADRLVAACERSMPDREYRVVVIDEEDIPF